MFIASSYLFDQADLFCVFALPLLYCYLWVYLTHGQASCFNGPVDHVVHDLGIVFLTALVLFV